MDGSAGNDAYAYALAAHDWLVNNIAYDAFMSETDEGNGVAGALLSRSTMCQGYAESFELLMRCMSDADVRMVVGKGKSEDDSEWVDHAWNIINLDGLWYQVDATFDDPVNSDRKDASHIYFARNDTGMGGDHTWNAEYWPAADSEDFRYYHESGLYAKSKKKLRSIVKKLLKKSEPTEPELAVEGVTLKENDLQFIYDSYDKVENILYSFTEIGDVTIVNLQLEY
ncbi:MAG: hypothetical protein LBT52_00465 [Clostridiales Family XIII bacterium]|nr:hypothetical protein [Clostridiales Family XIII bacterium]